MSSSSSTAHRARVLRDVATTPVADLVDLGSLTAADRRAVDPSVVAEARERGFADGRADGYREGYLAGHQEALREAARNEAARDQAAERALAALAAAAADVHAHRGRDIEGIEQLLVDAALELATAIVGRELEVAETPGRDALVRALRVADGMEPAVARLHPADVDTLGVLDEVAPGREITVVPDPAVEPGGCIVEVGNGRIDAQLGTAIERIGEVLRA